MTIARIVDELRIRFDNDGEAFAIEGDDLDAWQAETGLQRREILDALGLHLARAFADRSLAFNFCGKVVNALLWHVWLDPEALDGQPASFCAIFGAFEAGERVDLDNPGVDTAERDTRPRIDDILRRTIH